MKILVVDPDPSIRALLMALLRRARVDADCAGDFDTAMRRVARQRYAAAICEPRMPYGDELLAELAAAAATIIVTTTPDAYARELASRPRVAAVLLKPFEIEKLYRTLRGCGGVRAQGM